MKLIKKSIAVLLALLMVFSSFSMLTASASGIYDWSVDTKFYRMQRNADGYIVDADGNVIGDADDNLTAGSTPVWVETTNAKKGEKIKARFFYTTNFAMGVSQFIHVYPLDTFTMDESAYTPTTGGYKLKVNTENEKVANAGLSGTTDFGTGITGWLELMIAYSLYELDEADYEGLGWVIIQPDTAPGGPIENDGSFWLYEMDFIVNKDATELGKVYIPDASIADCDNFEVPTYVGVSEGGVFSEVYPSTDDWDYLINYPTLNDQDEDSTLGYKSTITLNAAGGKFTNGKGEMTVENEVAPFTAAAGVESPSKAGSIFTGWTATYTDSGESYIDGLVQTADIKAAHEDITYTANYISSGKTVTVTVNYIDAVTGETKTTTEEYSTSVGNKVVIVDEKPAEPDANTTYIVLSELPKVEHYEFDIDNNAEENLKLDEVTADEDAVITVNYKPVDYTATFDPANGEAATTITEAYNTEITAPAAPVKANSKFTGWSNGTETIQPGDKFNIAGNVTYTAQYENLYNVTYAYEGEIPEGYVPDASTTTAAGATIAAPAVEAPRGYELVWNVTGATENADGSYTAGANDVAFVGTWAKKTTTLSFIFAGDYPEDAEPIAPITVKFGDGDGAAISIINAYMDEKLPAGYTMTVTGMRGFENEDSAYPTVGTEPVSIIITWNRIPQKITYAYEGDVPAGYESSVEYVSYKDTITLETPAEEGYTFKGWTVEGADYNAETGVVTVGTTAATITGTWAKNYIVNYEFVGSGEYPEKVPAIAAPEADPVINGDKVVVPENPSADGYNFIEWTVEGATYDAETDSYIVDGSDVTVTGVWEAIEYKYRYYLDDEKTIIFTTKKYTYGDVPVEVDLPTDEQLTAKGFDGWTADFWNIDTPETVTGDLDFVLSMYQKDYYVEFYNRDGDNLLLNNDDYGIYVLHGETVDPSIVVESADVEGYTATGEWHIGDDEGEIAVFPYKVTEEVAFYADYTINKHNIIYYADEEGKSEYESFTVDYNTVITEDHIPAGTPEKEGHSFIAWIEETTGSEIEDYLGNTMPDEDVKVYPEFDINDYTITWVIDGKEQSAPQTFGEKIVAPADPAKEGFTFKGWATSENGAVIDDLGTVPANDNTKFYAIFAGDDHIAYTINKYFMNTDGSYEGVEADIETAYGVAGEKATYTPAEVEGFKFDDTQANVLEGTIAGNGSLELVVYYSRNKVNVTINGNTEEKYYGEEITTPETPDADPGYEFDKWVDENDEPVVFPVTVGTDPIVIKPTFKAETDTEYLVEIYEMDVNGEFKLVNTLTKTGTTDTEATYTPAVKEGFTADAESYTTVIKADTSDTIKVYYSRNKVNVTINDKTEEKYYGEEITEPTETPDGDPGYEFDKWVDENGDEVIFPVIVGTDPIVIKPTFKAETATEYLVEIYEMDVNGEFKLVDTLTKTGTTDTEATYTPAVKEGFTADAESYTTVIKADTSDTIKVYYSRNKVNVTINGNTEEKYYGEQITTPETPEADEGYEFDKWVDENGDEVKFPVTVGTDPIVIKPTFKAETDTEYLVEIYEMDVNGEFKLVDTLTKTGETDTEATYTPAVKEGFTADAESYTTVIKADTSDTIKVYYSRNKVNVTINGNTEEKYYGEEIPAPETPKADEGEEFDKWVDENGNEVTFPVIVGKDPIVINPSFKPIKYTVEFIVPGMDEAYASGEFDHGAAVQKPADPTVAGYEFKGWSLTEKGEIVDPATMTVPVDGITFYAILEANTDTAYTVKMFFMNEDGSDWMAPVDEVRYGTTGETVTLDFDKEAAEGFTIDEANSTKSAEILGNGTTVLVIYYNRDTVKVTINGTTTDEYYGTEIEEPTAPKAETGFEFGGWVDENGDPITFPISVGTEDIVIKPVWNKLSFNLTFKDAKGNVISGPVSTEYDADITAPEVEDKEGYTFIGWIAEVTGEKFNGKMPAKDVVYVETWNDGNYVPYKVETWIMNLAGEYELTTEAYGSALTGNTQGMTANEIPGFSIDAEKSVLSAVIVGDGSTVLKAYYARDKYTVTFDGENAQQIFFGAAIPVVEPAEQTGKTFTGWVVDGTNEKAPATMPANDVDLVSTWTDTEYTITFIVEGKIIATDKYTFGAEVTAPEAPEVDGKKFVEWAPAVPETMPAENLIISAIFDSAVYKVTFVDFDGNAFVEMQVRAGDEIVLPVEKPTKEFYVFRGWLDVPGAMPSEDITIKPDFERVPVVLVPEEGATTVIDRENMVIYGLEIFLDEELIDEYLAVEGDGYYTVTPVAYGCYGTGTVIEVYDRMGDGTPLETFHIVVFGDLNGDARINAVDTAMADDESLMLTDWSLKQVYKNGELVDNENYKVYMAIAADVNGKDGRIDATDVSDIRDTSLLVVDINQVEGIVER